MERGRRRIGFGSNEAAGQFTRFMWRNHRFHSFLTLYAFALSVKHLSLRHYHGDCFRGEIPDAIHPTQLGVVRFKRT